MKRYTEFNINGIIFYVYNYRLESVFCYYYCISESGKELVLQDIENIE